MKTDPATLTSTFEQAKNYLTSARALLNVEHQGQYSVATDDAKYYLSSAELPVFAAGYRAAMREASSSKLPPFPKTATFDEVLLAVMRLGYVVQLDTDPRGENGALHKALFNLQELGWPVEVIRSKECFASERQHTYHLTREFVPNWTDGLPIPIVKMSGG